MQVALLSISTLLLARCADALKCFSGDPIFQNECTSLSYCLMIISRTGRSQWSCDGNAFSQVSLCSTLGLQKDVEEESSLGMLSRKRYPDHLRRQEPLVRSPFESVRQDYRRPKSAALYPTDLPGARCFNGGELGRICCCNTDFCNAATVTQVNVLLWSLLTIWAIL